MFCCRVDINCSFALSRRFPGSDGPVAIDASISFLRAGSMRLGVGGGGRDGVCEVDGRDGVCEVDGRNGVCGVDGRDGVCEVDGRNVDGLIC